jgi:predicted alpha/beta-hydrolase family hydrolase
MSLVDLEQRERAIRELATSLALSAGAGSGKTSVLSSRIAEHLATAPRHRASLRSPSRRRRRASSSRACATRSRSVSSGPSSAEER